VEPEPDEPEEPDDPEDAASELAASAAEAAQARPYVMNDFFIACLFILVCFCLTNRHGRKP
jgi:hypothetical protein